MLYYNAIIALIGEYFKGVKGWKNLFLEGGCFWLARYLNERIPGSYLVINKEREHCAICIDSKYYDVLGRVSNKGFRRASEGDISFMEKNYIPPFDVCRLEHFISNTIEGVV